MKSVSLVSDELLPGDLFMWVYVDAGDVDGRYGRTYWSRRSCYMNMKREKILSSCTYSWVPVDSVAILISSTHSCNGNEELSRYRYPTHQEQLHYTFLTKSKIYTIRESDGSVPISVESGYVVKRVKVAS